MDFAQPTTVDREHDAVVPHEINTMPQGQWALLWKRKWLLLLGVVVGLGFGYLMYSKETPVFRTSARIQVLEPYASRSMPVDGIETGRIHGSLLVEATVISSEAVLKRAAELGELSELEIFAGMSNEQIAWHLIHGLGIKSVGNVSNSAVFEISYQCANPAASQRVVQSVIDAYSEHLSSQHRDVGQDTLDLIKQAQGEVAERLAGLESEYDDFKRKSSLIYRNGERTSVHQENADMYLTEKQSLLIRQTRLQSKLAAIEMAVKSKQPSSAILLMLLSETPQSVVEIVEDSNSRTQTASENGQNLVSLSRAEMAREQQLRPLELQESELLAIYGPEHPFVRELQARINVQRGLIEEIERNEKRLDEQTAQARAALLASLASAQQPDGSSSIDEQVRLHVLALQQQESALRQELQVLTSQYETELAAARNESQMEIESTRFERDIERQRSLYEKIVARFDELDLMSDSQGLRVNSLETPKYGYQTGPSLSRFLGLGGSCGFSIMLALAYLFEWANQAYRSAEEVAQHLKLPVLGHVPITTADRETRKAKHNRNSKLSPVLCTFFRSKSINSEAYRAIRTALFFSNQGHGQQVLQVTSAVPADGKTTIAANIAISMAQMGKNVLLLDADLRRPQVAKLFGIEAELGKGLATLLDQMPAKGTVPAEMLKEVIHATEVPNLSLMPAGRRPENPAELLSSDRFDHLMEELRTRFDIIIVDSPPLLAVSDPSNIAPRVDGVLFVIRLRKNARPLAAQAARVLETLESKVIGVIINGIGSREAGEYGKYVRRDGYFNRGRYYKYGYGYTYGYSYGEGEYGEYYREETSKR
jgi:capsular exopolysaccharide synthesis family protein